MLQRSVAQPHLGRGSSTNLPCRFTDEDVSMMLSLLQGCGLQLRSADPAGMKVRCTRSLADCMAPVCHDMVDQAPSKGLLWLHGEMLMSVLAACRMQCTAV